MSQQHAESVTLAEHQEALLAKRVMDVGTDQQTLIDYDGGADPVYIGYGAKSLATSKGGWNISKLTYSGGNLTTIKHAIGAWDNRASLTYE